MKVLLIIVASLIIYSTSHAQYVSNVRAKINDNIIVVNYDLTNQPDVKSFFIQLFSSIDNYSNELKLVNGDVGNNVTAGVNKKIVWNYNKEISKSPDYLDFKVVAKVDEKAVKEYENIVLQGYFDVSRKRIGDSIFIDLKKICNQTNSLGKHRLKIELIKGSLVFKNIFCSSEYYFLIIPNTILNAQNYQVRITDSNNNYWLSNKFTIGKKRH